MLKNDEVIASPRFRRAILSGGYYRSVTVFLRIQFPEAEDVAALPHSAIVNAKKCVEDALFARLTARREMEREMR